MALFRCTYSQGGGSGIPLVVTCASAFAGLTITCTDGTTTLTDTCPSSSPYEITFNLPNTGTWTVSGTISGTTHTESVLVEEFDCVLTNNIDLSVDFYSAANDTVSYTGLDNRTHTITTDSNGHASAIIKIAPTGTTNITFTSSVAKTPSNLSNDYSKSVALESNTTSVYVMPNGTVMYWWGYVGSNTQNISTSNGWGFSDYQNTFGTPVYNTNNIVLTGGTNLYTGIGKKTSTAFNGTHHIISKGETNSGLAATTGANKLVKYESPTIVITPSSSTNMTYQSSSYSSGANVVAHGRKATNNQMTLWAWWVVT